MSLRESAGRWLVRQVLRELDRALEERRGAARGCAAGAGGLAAAAAGLEAPVAALEAGVDAVTPFSGGMTVHRAWARHPGVRRVFAGYHLPACDRCAVGEDETLEEAAEGYQIPLETLLRQLNALL
jgi:hypothetical protein